MINYISLLFLISGKKKPTFRRDAYHTLLFANSTNTMSWTTPLPLSLAQLHRGTHIKRGQCGAELLADLPPFNLHTMGEGPYQHPDRRVNRRHSEEAYPGATLLEAPKPPVVQAVKLTLVVNHTQEERLLKWA